MAVAEVDQRVDRQAQTDAQQMMGELQAETARQKQELQFYRGLVVRQYGSGDAARAGAAASAPKRRSADSAC